MIDYSCVDTKIDNPVDIILTLQKQCPSIKEEDEAELEKVNVNFNKQLQILNQNKYILKKENTTSEQFRQALFCIIDALHHIQNMYSSNYELLKKYYDNVNSANLKNSINPNELLEEYKKNIADLQKDIYKLNLTYKKIDIAQIREITLSIPKDRVFSIYDKINAFFAEMNTIIKDNNTNQIAKKELCESDIMFAQIQEILFHLDDEFVDKLPDNMKLFIFNYSSFLDYEFKYDFNQTLSNQAISDDTRSIIAYFDYNYWADEEAKKLIETSWNSDVVNENPLKTTEMNTVSEENLEENNNIESTVEEKDNQLIVKKDNWFTRMINKIKSFLKK